MYNVISKLNKGDNFVCFRESKLTRLLQPYLGGNSLTAVICTVSPLISNLQESANTLRFGTCAGGVKNDVKVNLKDVAPPVALESLAAMVQQARQQEQELGQKVEQDQKLVEDNEAHYEALTKELEVIYETYLEALQIKKDLVNLKAEKKSVLESSRAKAAE